MEKNGYAHKGRLMRVGYAFGVVRRLMRGGCAPAYAHGLCAGVVRWLARLDYALTTHLSLGYAQGLCAGVMRTTLAA